MDARRARRLAGFAALGLAVLVVLLVAIAGLVVHMHPGPMGQWVEFSIGPATGDSTSINPTLVRSDGITVRTAIATAYEFPAVRVIGPPWLSRTRYALTAVAADKASFHPALRKELDSRFHLATHVEPKRFDVFLLTATSNVRLLEASRPGPSTWIEARSARLKDASSERIAAAVQLIVGKPVIDETGLRGSYDLSLDWTDDAVASLTPFLRERFGLQLSPAQRDLDVLMIDRCRPDAALLVLGPAAHLTRPLPAKLRERVAGMFTVR